MRNLREARAHLQPPTLLRTPIASIAHLTPTETDGNRDLFAITKNEMSSKRKSGRRKSGRNGKRRAREGKVVLHVNRLLEPLRRPPWTRTSEDLAIILQFVKHLPFISQFSGKGGVVSDLQKNIASMLGVRVCRVDEVVFEVRPQFCWCCYGDEVLTTTVTTTTRTAAATMVVLIVMNNYSLLSKLNYQPFTARNRGRLLVHHCFWSMWRFQKGVAIRPRGGLRSEQEEKARSWLGR